MAGVRAGTHFDLGIPATAVRQLIGIGPDRFGQLVVELEPIWQARRAERLSAASKSPKRKPGAGRPPIPFAVRLMAALIDMRWAPPRQSIADLLGISRDAVRRTADELRELVPEGGAIEDRRLRPEPSLTGLLDVGGRQAIKDRLAQPFSAAPWA